MRQRRTGLTKVALEHVSAAELVRLGLDSPAPNVETSVAPAAAHSLERLRRRLRDEAWEQVSPEARMQLARHITSRFATMVGRSLVRFARTLGHRLTTAETMAAECAHGPSSVERFAPGQAIFLDAISAFPAFAETVHLLMVDWVEANAELLLRFGSDRMELMRSSGGNASGSAITSILPGLSDPQDGCRSVTELQLCDGTQIIYKPRCCSGEILWNRALCWINSEGFLPTLKPVGIKQRRGYGWIELVRPEPCDSLDAVHRAFHRWGALTAIAEALSCVDLHHENWIAAGEHPILVDAEAYGEHAWRVRRRGGRKHWLPSVLRTGLFPMRSDEGMPDYRGIAPFDTLQALKTAPTAWPVFAGTARIPHEHADDIAAGYEAMFTFLQSHRDRHRRILEIAAQAARRRSNRLFVRSTTEYQRLLEHSLNDVELFGAQTRYDGLFERCAASAPSREIAAAEANALLRCSMPRFTSAHFPGRVVCPQIHGRSAARMIRRRLLAFG